MEALVANITATCPLPFSGVTGQLFARAVATAVAAHCVIFDDYHWPKDNAQDIIMSGPKTFDFVIVGAGTAGSALAGNLAAMYEMSSILLIEAGDDPKLNSEIPAFLLYNHDIDWEYDTITYNACLGYNNNKCIWHKGKSMGGSSSINAMLYIRGHPYDYEHWEQIGNPGWEYDKLSPYFSKAEEKINLTTIKHDRNIWYDMLEEAFKQYNILMNANNDEGLIGTKITKLLTRNGKRLNTAKVYLKESKNLYVMKNSMVEKVIIDVHSKRATHVQVRHKSGIVKQIIVQKEVILSAGSIATPHILMLSGIGSEKHLNEKGIESIMNLPVGKNLQDHIIFPLFLKTNLTTEVAPEALIQYWIQYMLTKTGPLSNIGLSDFMSFIDTKNESVYPDIQFHFMNFNKKDKFMLRPYLEGYGFKNEIIKSVEDLNRNNDLLGIYPTLLHPKSRGEILLHDANPKTMPKIVTNYFEDVDDIKTLLRAIQFVKKLQNTEVFKRFQIKIVPLTLSGCEDFIIESDDYWECYIRHMATTVYHPVGTAKMAPKDDSSAVVNHDLLIHGLNNLRVVDASIMPIIPGSNIMAPTLMIAEKASDIIRKKYLNRDEL
ncbi:hypothetical protein ACJJTC_005961 [Scirpophaga incertulas]